MLIRVSLLAALVVLVALSAPVVRAAQPRGSVFVLDHSLGDAGVGMKKERALREWGKQHGVCHDCCRTT